MPDLTLGPRFEEYIEQQVRSGRFLDASEVVRAGLRMLEDHERDNVDVAVAINEAFEECGADISAADVFARIEQQFAQDMKAPSLGT